jgi:predicted HAD superfamily Cof-like phosphohydrolase
MKSNFEDVGDFHRKFGLETTDNGAPQKLSVDAAMFRLKFLLEEVREYADAAGFTLDYAVYHKGSAQDLPGAFDALIDLVYVALGTAQMHRFPWAEGWAAVQAANMTKERCGIDHKFVTGVGPKAEDPDSDGCMHPLDESTACGKTRRAHSVRGSALDVIKPEGWNPPTQNVIEALMRAGWQGPALPLEAEE